MEATEKMLDLITLSRISSELCDTNVIPLLQQLHSEFTNLKIPFECVGEGAKVYHHKTGKSYQVVSPQSALPEGS